MRIFIVQLQINKTAGSDLWATFVIYCSSYICYYMFHSIYCIGYLIDVEY